MLVQQELIDKIIPVLKRHPIKKAALFGSFARGEQRDDSDLDVLLDLDLTNELPDIIYVIWDDLEKNVHIKTDIMTFKALKSLPSTVQARIQNDMRYFYEV
jgi:predicted nucleotidyltransferase